MVRGFYFARYTFRMNHDTHIVIAPEDAGTNKRSEAIQSQNYRLSLVALDCRAAARLAMTLNDMDKSNVLLVRAILGRDKSRPVPLFWRKTKGGC